MSIKKKKVTLRATEKRIEKSKAVGIPQEELTFYKIGENLRQYRNEKGLKLQGLARAAGMSASLLSKIENGRMIPTIPTLFSVINELGIEPEKLFAGLKESNSFPGYLFIPQKEYVPYVKEEKAKGFNYFSIIERKLERGSLQISLLQLHPGAKRAVVSTAGFEFFYLISGSIKYELGDKKFNIHAGDSLFFDGNIPHRPLNPSGQTAMMLVIYLYGEAGQSPVKKKVSR